MEGAPESGSSTQVPGLLPAVARLRLSIVVQFVTGPKQPIGQQTQIMRITGGFEIVAQGRGEDASFAVAAGPANDVFALVARTFSAQQWMRARQQFDRLIKFIPRRFPVGGPIL